MGGVSNKQWYNGAIVTLVYIQHCLSQWGGYWSHATQPQKPLNPAANFREKLQPLSSKELHIYIGSIALNC